MTLWRPREATSQWPGKVGKEEKATLGKSGSEGRPEELLRRNMWFPPSLILIHWETFVSLYVDRKDSVVRGTFENTEKEDRLRNTAGGVSIGKERGFF